MPKNIAEEIIEAETKAKRILQDALAEGAKLLAQTRAEAETLAKESRHRYHRTLREAILQLEESADRESEKTVEKGRNEAEELVKNHRDKVNVVAEWVAEEVMSRYGSDKG